MPEIPGVVQTNSNNDISPEFKHLQMAINEVYSKKNIELKTDLSDNLIKAIARGKLYYKQYGITIVKDLVNEIMMLRVSRNRLGRTEFTKIVQSMNSFSDIETKPSLNQKLFRGL
jgi:phosphatidate phosphatase APP1